MLQSIRDKAQGWIAWVIVILIAIPFALFGIQEYLGVSGDPVVAEVEGVEIKRSDLDKRIRDVRDSMRMTLGESYQQEMFEGETFEREVLDRMIDENVVQQASSDWNMRASDAQARIYIQSIPAFQNEGAFDNRLYEASIRNRGYSNAGFEALVRQELVNQQLRNGVAGSAFLTDAAFNEMMRLAEQKREIAYTRIPAAQYNQASLVDEQQAQAYYEANPDEYRVPERVKLAYLRLSTEVLSPLVEVDEEGLRAYFNDHRDSFAAAEERQTRHILLAANEDNLAEQQAKAEALLQQLNDGADFAELAKANSDDTGSAANGGDLGWVSRGMMVEPFENSTFALAKDQVSELVKTQFGFHIIQVTDIRGSEPLFEDVRDEVDQAYRKQQAEELYFNQFERLADAAYENPDSLIPAAEALGLQISKTDWVSRESGMPEALNVAKAVNAAFSEDVLQRGNNSEVIELGSADALVLRVLEHEPETIRPFADVREQVLVAAAAQLASEKAADRGRELLSELRGGASFENAAAANGWQLNSELISRNTRSIPAEIVDAAFSLAPPAPGQSAYTGVVSAEGDYLMVQVKTVTDGDNSNLEAQVLDLLKSRAANSMGNAELSGLSQALRERSNVEISTQ